MDNGDYPSLASLKARLVPFGAVYDYVRLVDPVMGIVVESDSVDGGAKGYEPIWHSQEVLKGSISLLANRYQRTFSRVENTREKTLLATAFPIRGFDRPLVLEFMKDMTNSIMFGEDSYKESRLLVAAMDELKDDAVRDALTGVYNRRFLTTRLDKDIVKSVAAHQQLTILFLDVDNMKGVNDAYGHAVGDRALQELADKIVECIRSGSDWVVRYGGDEFLVCLMDTDEAGATRAIDRMERRINSGPIDLDGERAEVTVSIGSYTMPLQGTSSQEIIDFADERMYASKRSRF